MSILDTFYILFDSDASKLDKGLAESEKKAEGLVGKLAQVDKEGAKAGEQLFAFAGKAAGLLGLGMSVGVLVSQIKETAAAYDELGKLAARFRSTAEAVDEFRDSSELLGISNEKSTGALMALDTAIQDTFLDMGRSKKVFEELGITVTDAAGKIKPTTTVMGELAEKLHGMERGTQIRVMERLGLDPVMLKLFNADFINLQKRMADVDKASGFNLDQAVKRSAEYTKASKALALEVNTVRLLLEKMGEGLKVAALPYFTHAMEIATKYAKMFVDFLMKHSKFVEGIMIAAGAAIMYFLVPAAIKGAIAVWAMIAPFALIGAAVAAVAVAFALLYDDITNYIEGNDSMIGRIVEKWPEVGDMLKALGAEFVFFWDVLKAIGNFLVGMFDNPAAAFERFKGDLISGVNKLIDHFPGLREVIGGITDAFTTAADTIVGVWDAIVAAIKAAISTVTGAIDAVVNGFARAKAAFGFGGGTDLSTGKDMLATASAAALAPITSNSINAGNYGRNTTVSVGKVEVHTQATDAEGISKSIGNSMQAQMRQAVSNYDDGVAG